MNYKSVLWIFIFTLGLIGGTLYVNFDSDKKNVCDIGKNLLSVDNFDSDDEKITKIIHIVTERLKILIFFAINALLCRKSLVLCIPTALLGGCFGVIISMVTLTYGWSGIRQLFWYLMPHYVFYIAGYCVLIRHFEVLYDRHKRYRHLKSIHGEKALLKFIGLVLAGIMSECYVNQWIIQYFVKKN